MTTSQLFESFRDVPAVWHEICDKNDVGMDLALLAAFQETLRDQCRCWALLVFDDSGAVIGCAALAQFQTELVETNNAVVIQWRGKVRRLWPNFLTMGVMFCGLPVPSGSTHLRVRSDADIPQVVAEVDRVLRELARATRSKLTIFKEFDASNPAFKAAFESIGYVSGGIPPMHHLDVSFKNFNDYQNAIKSRYRAQIRRSQEKLAAAGFEVTSGWGYDFFSRHFNDEVHKLYVGVQQRAKQKLELMPPAFFIEVSKALGDDVLMTVISRQGKICAFTWAFKRGTTHYNMYSGLDYDANNDGDLYFNLFYNDMDQAFQSGATSIHMGQTSDSFKSRLGTSPQPLWFYAKACSPLFNKGLHRLAPLVFPKVEPVEPNDVFSTPPKPKKSVRKAQL